MGDVQCQTVQPHLRQKEVAHVCVCVCVSLLRPLAHKGDGGH